LKALVLTEYKHLELQEVAPPVAGPGELLIAVRACGICGSDVHGYDGSTGRRRPPIIMGHEAAGVVAALGEGVTGFAEGDRVTFDSTVYCGECHFCHNGQVNLCDRREVIGVSTSEFRRMGAFAEYVIIPARIAYHLPPEMPFAHAAMVEAVSVAVHAVSLTPVQLNDTAVVVGAGMIGLLTLQAVKLAGVGRVIVMDVDDKRLEMATRMGATQTINSLDGKSASAAVRSATAGRGADIVLECVGTTPTVQLCIDSVRKGGTVTLIGNVTPTVEINLQSCVTRQIRLQGSCASSGEYPACLSMMARGAIRVDELLSAVAPLNEGVQWFERLYTREPGLLKVVLEPQS
jgi:L-iditol 2-dehydrogenase